MDLVGSLLLSQAPGIFSRPEVKRRELMLCARLFCESRDGVAAGRIDLLAGNSLCSFNIGVVGGIHGQADLMESLTVVVVKEPAGEYSKVQSK